MKPESDGDLVLDDAHADAHAPLHEQAGTREYQVLSVIALGMIFLLDIQQGSSLLTMLLLLVGTFGMLTRLRIGPVLFLLVFAILQLTKQTGLARLEGLPVPPPRGGLNVHDVVYSMAVLAFALAQYRLQGLLAYILPPDPRRRFGPRRWWIFPPKLVLRSRPSWLVTPREIGWFLLGLPVWALVGQALWSVLFAPRPVPGLETWLNRLVYFGWGAGLTVLIAAGSLELWRRRRSSPDAAALYLQDVLWRETRGEQRRLNRWIVWRRLN